MLQVTRRFELVGESDYKFWSIRIDQQVIHRRFGRIGAKGRSLAREYSDLAAAATDAERMVEEKLGNGYQKVFGDQVEKIQPKGLASLERKEVSPLVKKAVRIYTNTSAPFCEPVFCKFDSKNSTHRLSDQVLGGFPYTSDDNPWPQNSYGVEMQFLAQVDLANASQLLGEDFGSDLLQVFAHDHDFCDEFLLRVISRQDLSSPMHLAFPKHMKEFNRDGMLNLGGMRVKSPRIEWKPAQLMHYPSIWSRICGADETVEVIEPSDVSDALSDAIDEDGWASGINRPVFKGLRGRKRCPNVYLGGYPFGEGNGWNLHHPSRRPLLNIWADSGVLWHLCVWMDADGQFSADVACTR